MLFGEEDSSQYRVDTVIDGFAIAELYLASRNIECSIDRYLLENGTMVDTRTQAFLANIREVMGAVSRQARKVVHAQVSSD